MTIDQLIAHAESLGITRGYDYPGFSTLARDERVAIVRHFAKPAKKKPAPVSADETETMSEYLDRVAPIDDMPHRFAHRTR